jgi:hypothetical protein
MQPPVLLVAITCLLASTQAFSGSLAGTWALVSSSDVQKSHIPGLKIEAKKIKVFIPSGSTAKPKIQLQGTFRPAGRNLRAQGKWLFKCDPNASISYMPIPFSIDVVLDDDVTPVAFIATDPQGHLEMERLEIRLQEIK